MFRIFILLIYCAASGDIMDNDSEYITNDVNDNNNGSETGGDIVDNEYFANDEYDNTDNTQNTTSGHNPQTSSCVTTGGGRTGAHCVFPFQINVRMANMILLI